MAPSAPRSASRTIDRKGASCGNRLIVAALRTGSRLSRCYGYCGLLRLSLVAILLVHSAAISNASWVEKIVFLERGIYHAQTDGPPAAGATNSIYRIRSSRLIVSTTTIPGRLYVRFGLRYMVVGTPNGSVVPLRMITRYPDSGLLDPNTGQRLHRSEFTINIPIGAVSYRDHHFDHEWEIVPGRWAFEFWQGDRKLGEQDFCVLTEAQQVAGDAAKPCLEKHVRIRNQKPVLDQTARGNGPEFADGDPMHGTPSLATALLSTLLLGSAAHAQTPKIERVHILERGIYVARTDRSRAPADGLWPVFNVRLSKATSSIPMRRDLRFGVRYVLRGTPHSRPVMIELVTRYPEPGMLDRSTGLRRTESRHQIEVSVGIPRYREFQFVEEEEFVPGIWTFEFWQGDRKLGDQHFCVWPDDGISRPANIDLEACHATTS